MMDQSHEKVLVIAANGMLGREVVAQLTRRTPHVVQTAWPDVRPNQQLLDITDASTVKQVVAEWRPAVIYNCAAYTDVDGAEAHEDLATAVNGAGVRNLAMAAREYGSLLVHVSTDYVFDGKARAPYQPDDLPAPTTAYGRSKLAGELAISSVGGSGLIVRTSWLFGPGGKNFVDTIVSLARQKPELKIVNDQIGSPTYVPDLARCLIDLAALQTRGLYHFCNGPPCSWFDLAAQAVQLTHLPCRVTPCTTREFPRPAPRPEYSVLDCRNTFSRLEWTARPWSLALQDHLRRSELISNAKCQQV
jgi:dTDP-4-dehydrorhamnose reductase